MTVHDEVDGAVLRLTLDNGKHNLLTGDMYRQLCELLTRFMNDDELKVAILAGTPGNSFCGGDDLRARPRPAVMTPHWPTVLWAMPRNKPLIAAIDGWCLGGGFAVLLNATDMRVATPEAKFGFPEIRYGMGGLGGATRLATHLPRTVAMEMLLTGDYMTAAEAKRYDLVNRVVPADDLMSAADDLAARVARHPTLAIRTEMEAFTRSGDLSQADAVAMTKTLARYQMKLHEIDNAYDDIKIERPEPLDLP